MRFSVFFLLWLCVSSTSYAMHHIYVATWRGCEESCQGFMDYFKAAEMAVHFTVRSADQDPELLPAMVSEARTLRPDLILTWGSTVTLAFVGRIDDESDVYIRDIPVVFMYVSEMVKNGLTQSEMTTGRGNVAGTDYAVPIESQLNAISAYRPFRRLGILYDPTQTGSVQRVSAVRQLSEPLNFDLEAIPIPLDAQGRPDPMQLPQAVAALAQRRPDFVYFGYSSFLITHVEAFTRLAVEHQLPVFTAGPLPIVKGQALLGLFNRLSSVGQLAAYQAERILIDGADPATLPIARFNRYSMLINMPVARALQLWPPLSLLSYAEIRH